MSKFALVALGGALGAVARYAMADAVQRLAFNPFPWGTLSVNLLGCFLIGVAWAFAEKTHLPEHVAVLIFAGFLGSFTTFSTFSMETVDLLTNGRVLSALSYVLASTVLGIGCAWVAYVLVKDYLGHQ